MGKVSVIWVVGSLLVLVSSPGAQVFDNVSSQLNYTYNKHFNPEFLQRRADSIIAEHESLPKSTEGAADDILPTGITKHVLAGPDDPAVFRNRDNRLWVCTFATYFGKPTELEALGAVAGWQDPTSGLLTLSFPLSDLPLFAELEGMARISGGGRVELKFEPSSNAQTSSPPDSAAVLECSNE